VRSSIWLLALVACNGICVEACILELTCDGPALDYRGLYPDGSYVAHAKLLRR